MCTNILIQENCSLQGSLNKVTPCRLRLGSGHGVRSPVGPPRPSCSCSGPKRCVPACCPARTAWQRRRVRRGKAKQWTQVGSRREAQRARGLRQTGLCSGSLKGPVLGRRPAGPWSLRRWEHTASSWLHGIPANTKPLTRRAPSARSQSSWGC